MTFVKLDSLAISCLRLHSRSTFAASKYSQYVLRNDSSSVQASQRSYHRTFIRPLRKLNICVPKNNSNLSIRNLCACTPDKGRDLKLYRSLPRLHGQLSTYSQVSGLSDSMPLLPSSLTDLNDDQLLNLVAKLAEQIAGHEILDDGHRAALDALDQECIRRASSCNFAEFLHFLNRYASVRAPRSEAFLSYAMNRRMNSALEAPRPCLLEYLRVLNEAKVWYRYKKSKQLLADSFGAHFDHLSWAQIDVFLEPLDLLGCILVDDRLKKKICRKLIADFDDVTNVRLTRIFRLFYAQTLYPKNFLFMTPWLLHILDAMVAKIDSFDLECLRWAGQLCAKMFVYDVRLLRALADRLLLELPQLEPARVAGVVSVLTYFNYQLDSTDLYGELTAALEADESKFVGKPRSLMQILSHLSIVGVYSHKYLDTVFSDRFQRSLLGHKLNAYRVTPEMLVLHGGAVLECPQYAGNQLDGLLHVSLLRRSLELPVCLRKPQQFENLRCDSMPPCLNAPRNISTFYRVLYCTRGLLNELFGGAQYTHVCFLLPQFKRATIIFSLDANGRPEEIPGNIRRQRIVGRSLLDSGMDWYAFTFRSHNIYTDSEAMLMGDEIAKDRQLRRCGLRIVSITQHGWLKMEVEEKLRILREEISKAGVDLRVAERTT